jgi:hypothetical protein
MRYLLLRNSLGGGVSRLVGSEINAGVAALTRFHIRDWVSMSGLAGVAPS